MLTRLFSAQLSRPIVLCQRALVMLLALLLGGGCFCGCERAPGIRLLPPGDAAKWIRYPNPPDILAHLVQTNGGALSGIFRRSFVLQAIPSNAVVRVRALESFGLTLNGHSISPRIRGQTWKQASEFYVVPILQLGTNEIVVTVTNRAGPPLFWSDGTIGSIEINSDTSWKCSLAGAVWQSAQLASAPQPFRLGNPMHNERTIWESVRRTALASATLLLLSVALTVLAARCRTMAKPLLTQSEITKFGLAGLVVLWVLLFTHNVKQMGPTHGFDTVHHVNYIKFIQANHALPKTEAGWEMHQPPLYYVIAAAALQLFQWDAATPQGLEALRYLSMLFAVGQILLVYASLRLLVQNEMARPLIGAAMCAFLPAHIYHAHYITNETFLALLASGVFYLLLRVLRAGKSTPLLSIALGGVLGAALLTKLTALILAAVVLLAIIAQLLVERHQWRRWIGTAGVVFLACSVVAGWYYWQLWNAGGPWNNSRWAYGAGWWQEDGYRTAPYYFRFGESLVRPLFSGFHSFWDGVYSTLWGDGLCGGSTSVDFTPPWNYALVGVGYWLALFPTILAVSGFGIGCKMLLKNRAVEWLPLLSAIVLFALALVYFSLVAPGTSQVRASFGLMLMVPFCAMLATGFSRFMQINGLTGSAVLVLTLLWAFNSYCAHWAPPTSPQPLLARAKGCFERGLFEQAALAAQEGLRRQPSNASLRSILADCWNQVGRTNEAKELVERALMDWSNDPTAHLDAGFEHARAGRLDEALKETRQAIVLAPDNVMAARQLVALFLQAKRFGEAETACREALRTSPYDVQLHRWLRTAEEVQTRKQ